MPVALERPIDPAKPGLQASFADRRELQPDISVVFTSVEATLVALKEGGVLAKRLGAHITLVVPQIVPYSSRIPGRPFLLDRRDWRFSVTAEHTQVETTVHLFPCRDRLDKLITVLNPKSLVVIGGRRRWWWPTAEEVLARDLQKAGYEVILAEKKESYIGLDSAYNGPTQK
jgi:hypothetical protein